ncbi:MAG: DUF4956 domain-containing protein [Pseudomonadota bacterium]
MLKDAPLIRITAYYLVVTGAVWLLLNLAPSLAQHLPVGGVDDMAGGKAPSADAFEAIVQTQIAITGLEEAEQLFLALVGTILCILPIIWVYEMTRQRCDIDTSLLQTVMLLPVLVAGVVLIVQHSLALAFSLAGIVAAVQFRRALKATSDSLYIFAAVAVGLAAGVKSLEIAFIVSTFFNYAALAAHYAGYRECPENNVTKKKKKKNRPEEAATASSDMGAPAE